MGSKKINVSSVQETKQLAEKIGKALPVSSVVGLSGSLGAGKTEFVKHLAKSLGVTTAVSSPTYVVEQQYAIADSSQFVSHWDLYRLHSSEVYLELAELQMTELAYIVIEWPQKVEETMKLLDLHIELSFESNAPSSSREISIRSMSELGTKVISSL